MADSGGTAFKPKTVELLLKRYFKNDKTKINAKALAAAAEVLRLMVIEMIERAGEGARGTGDGEIDVTHLEKILPQLLLDF